MEVWTAAAALCVIAAAWRFWTGAHRPDPASAVLIGALGGACLYFSGCPDLHKGVVFCFCLVLFCVMMRKEELVPVQNRAVLVTGCDSGFGHALAVRLSEAGLQVFAGVLDVHGPGAEQLKRRALKNLHVLQLDVTDSSQVQTVFNYICAQVYHSGLWALVNNAGVLLCPTDAELQPLATLRRFMDVNFLSAVHMSQLFLPLLRRSRGRIVNVSSMAGEVPMPMFGAYGASKAALSIFSRVMRLELAPWGVKVVLIQPAGFRTNIFGVPDDVIRYQDELLTTISAEAREDYGDEYISSLPCCLSFMFQQSAEDLSPVVEDMYHAVMSVHPRPLYTPGQMGWLLPFLHRCCPTSMFDAIITRLPTLNQQQPAGLRRT
ncbi:estradiol 17-beta-dehydrogenase 2 [Melanotaenia boesemani]|uniref:estradiol 17-beta-dehydrogenase 2 n=1 Tax=Melanotaenia boesemani TaxID=1250792 RepID=UPI001C05191B|nr:estradiol 17-beta-dehydrogenase 2 [Melanotaenia boesemani]